jgi:hypothetical protein
MNEDGLKNASREEIMTAIFAGMVNQYAQMAFMFMGKVPNPQTGAMEVELESAKMFIDNLEMLEFKTKGNLSKEEDKFLKAVLTQLRMDFVESLDKPGSKSKSTASASAPKEATPETQAKPEAAAPSGIESGSGEFSEEKTRFKKKYD